MVKDFDLQNNFMQIKNAIIIAILFGLVTSGYFLLIQKEPYSVIYLVPGSIIHNTEDNTVFYEYGITSSENQKMDYTLETYIQDKLIKTKQFSLNNRETLEAREKIVLSSGEQYPEKISLLLKTGEKFESVHFWIN